MLCVQETKAQEHQLRRPRRSCPSGYTRVVPRRDAPRRATAASAIYSRREPDEVRTALGWAPFDDEGRYIEARFGNLSVVSFYIPSGSSGELRQGFKFEVMDWLEPILDDWLAQRPRLRAVRRLEHRAQRARHQELEVEPEELRLPAARARLAQRPVRRDRRGWVDAYRALHAEGQDYTWWSNRGAARANNVGWRIDYQFVHAVAARQAARPARSIPTPRFSDHAPFVVDYDL